MAQLCTATFITDSGFATGLTPTVTITEVLTWTVRWTFNMEEVDAWNYKYNYVDGSDQMLYFFKFDAGSDSVVNRYEWNTNKIDTVRWGGWGWTIIRNQTITQEQINDIAKKVIEMLPKTKEIKLDTKKIEETLGTIVAKINESVPEFDYEPIISSQSENTQKIIKKIDTIKIPKFDDSKIVASIKKVWEKEIDLSPMKDVCAKVDEMTNTMNKESKAIKTLNSVKEQLKSIEDEVEETTSIIQPQEEILDKKHIEELLKD